MAPKAGQSLTAAPIEEIHAGALAMAREYVERDMEEDRAVEGLLSYLRRCFAGKPRQLAGVERWAEYWRRIDAQADHGVLQGCALMVVESEKLRQRIERQDKRNATPEVQSEAA